MSLRKPLINPEHDIESVVAKADILTSQTMGMGKDAGMGILGLCGGRGVALVYGSNL